ncbi:MAG: glutathione S-transferase N-terminal domain-containing protein [Pseudomonadota bacterium]
MKLIGMLDSPFVRRVALTMAANNVAFEHASVSVFRDLERYRAVNPLLKSPTLICDDGTVLMDSSVILLWLEGIAGISLLPREPAQRTRAARRTALGLVAAEKAVQIEYERKRPEAQRSADWLVRVGEQVRAAFGAIEQDLQEGSPDPVALDGITLAAAWGFARFVVPDVAPVSDYPALAAYAADAENRDIYRKFPVDG